MYRKSLQENVIDKIGYEFFCNTSKWYVDETKKEAFL